VCVLITGEKLCVGVKNPPIQRTNVVITHNTQRETNELETRMRLE
jgi:hypothetical protein